MNMNVETFRRELSKQLDRAVQGHRVTVERGGVVFTVVPSVKPVNTPADIPAHEFMKPVPKAKQ